MAFRARRARRSKIVKRDLSMAEFGEVLRDIGREGVPALELDLQRAMHAELAADVEQHSPMGTVAKRRGRRLVAPGEFRRGIVSGIGTSRAAMSAEHALDRLQPRQESKIGSSAPHWRVIERGRKLGRSRRVSKAAAAGGARQGTRMMGSEQAPRGVFGPAVERLNASADRIMRQVLARAEEDY
jgi:hypothetical protein